MNIIRLLDPLVVIEKAGYCPVCKHNATRRRYRSRENVELGSVIECNGGHVFQRDAEGNDVRFVIQYTRFVIQYTQTP